MSNLLNSRKSSQEAPLKSWSEKNAPQRLNSKTPDQPTPSQAFASKSSLRRSLNMMSASPLNSPVTSSMSLEQEALRPVNYRPQNTANKSPIFVEANPSIPNIKVKTPEKRFPIEPPQKRIYPQTHDLPRFVKMPNTKETRLALSESVKLLNAQEKLNLLKISERSGGKPPDMNSRFDFYFINEKSIQSQMQDSNNKNIFLHRKSNDDFERKLLRTNHQKLKINETIKQETLALKPTMQAKPKLKHQALFTTFPKVHDLESPTSQKIRLLPALNIKGETSKFSEEGLIPKDTISDKFLVEKRGGKVNNDFLYNYLKAFCELENLSNEIIEAEKEPELSKDSDLIIDSKFQSRDNLEDLQVPLPNKTILDYAYVKNKYISLRALITKYPHIFAREDELGERILDCLRIPQENIDQKEIGFEHFHNFARFVLFYDASFPDLAEFLLRFFRGRVQTCSVIEFKNTVRILINEKYATQHQREIAFSKLIRQFELCKIIERGNENVNFENFKKIYGANKLNVFYLMDLATNKK